MDPNATLDTALRALAENDREGAAYKLDQLLEWINKGGFLPTVRSQPCNDANIRIYTVYKKGG